MDYVWIRKWGAFLGSNSDFIEMEVEKAREDRAPANAIYFSKTENRWMTTDDISSTVTREALGLSL